MLKRLTLLIAAAVAAGAFEIKTFQEDIPEANPVTRTQVTSGRTRFSFIAPPGWNGSADAGKRKLAFASASPRSATFIQMLTNSIPADTAQFKKEVTKELQNVEVVDEFQASSGGGPGLGIDLKHLVSGSPTLTRVTRFRAPEGSVQITISAHPDDFPALHAAWTSFINSFRVEPI